MNKKYKSIFNPGVARALLKLGNNIVDIKADKQDCNKTIFIFEETEKFIKDLVGLKSN